MKAWKQLHYDRAREFLSILSGSAVAETPIAATEPPSRSPSAAPSETVTAPVDAPKTPAVETVAPPATATSTSAHPPLVRVLPTVTAPLQDTATAADPAPPQPPANVATEPVSEEQPAPIKITPRSPAADRAPKEAGRFFGGIAWAGGEASFEAAEEPDIKPNISVGTAPETQTQRPPDRSNPILAATRSAMVTAEKAAATEGMPEVPVESNEAPSPVEVPSPSEEPIASSETPTSEPSATSTEGNAAGFFKNLNWKNN